MLLALIALAILSQRRVEAFASGSTHIPDPNQLLDKLKLMINQIERTSSNAIGFADLDPGQLARLQIKAEEQAKAEAKKDKQNESE